MKGTICILVIICDFTIFLKILFQIGASSKCFDRINKKPTNYLYTIPLFDFEKGDKPSQIGIWPGTAPGYIMYGKLNRGQCLYEEYCSSIIEEKDSKPLLVWKGYQFMISSNYSSYTYINLLNKSVLQNEECPPNLKQCGFLDTLNHKLCLEKEEECPINILLLRNSSEPPENYSYSFKKIAFNDGTYLFYTNEAIEQHIIAELLVSDYPICFNPYKYNLFQYVLYKDIECEGVRGSSNYNENYTQIDTMNLSLLYDENNITSIIKELPEFPLKKFKAEQTKLFYRTFVGYNKECMKHKKTKFFTPLSHSSTLSIIILGHVNC